MNDLEIGDRYRALQRRTMLDRLGVAFAESLDFDRTARAVVSAMCEDFADFAFLDVLGNEGRLERTAVEMGRLTGESRTLRSFVPPPDAAHPINAVLQSGDAMIVPVCDDAWMVATAWSPEHLAYVRSLPIASIAYVPMIAAGERIGVLTFGAVRGSGRAYSQADLPDAREVAGRAAVALANARLYRDLAASEERYRNIIETAQEGVWIIDEQACTRYVNARMSQILGYTADEMYGRRMFDYLVPGQLDEVHGALAKHRAGSGNRRESQLLHRDGHIVYAMVASNPILDADGTYTGSLGMFTDITERKAIETHALALARMREIVARASEVLSGSLNLDTLLGRFADLLVAEFADEATITVRPDRAVVRRNATPDPDAPALRAPLRHRDVEIGSVTVRASAPFGPSDEALLADLAARAAVAIENAQLYEREHRVAMTLQRAMLPAVLPHVPGLEFDAVYYPGLTEAEIGGDWYDAFALGDGRIVISIGDVTGRGLTAAVIMGRMRQAIETLSTYESDPARLLDAVDKVLRRAHPDAIVTALVGVVEPATRTLAYATAGHPTPIVRGPDGSVRHLPGRGLPLGLRDGGEPPTMSIELPAGSLTVFFTDGLVEATRDIGEGEQRLFAALLDPTIDEGSPAAALVAHVLGGEGVHDDVAVLTLRLLGDPAARAWTMRWRFDPSDWRRAYDVRETIVEALELHARNIDISAAELVFGELIGNAVRHAPGTVDVELTIDDPTRPELHVIDDGPGYSARNRLPPDDAESGRGLYLVARLTREFTVTKAQRGAHARAVLLSLS